MIRTTSNTSVRAPMRLAYVAVEARSLAHWERFCETMLGLPEAVRNLEGSRGWRLDDAVQRLIVSEGRADDLAALGFECEDERTLDTLLVRLRQRGIAVADGDGALRGARRVQRLHTLHDPDGNAVELSVGLARTGEQFAS